MAPAGTYIVSNPATLTAAVAFVRVPLMSAVPFISIAVAVQFDLVCSRKI